MSALLILIAISLLVAGGFLVAFLWSTKSGQYDDDYTPSVRILFDDVPKASKEIKEKTTSSKEQKNQVN
ncbi:MAG: cbb3-type cytochrome oxidase assembly protein CcoS [Ginsengibacter sp.]